MYGLMSGACLLIFVLYDEPGYVGDADQASCTLLLLLLYGAAALPMVYCYSFGFESHSTAQIVIMVLSIISPISRPYLPYLAHISPHLARISPGAQHHLRLRLRHRALRHVHAAQHAGAWLGCVLGLGLGLRC